MWIGVFAAAICAAGCTGRVTTTGNAPQAQPPTGQTFTISGTLSPTAGGSGATVTLSGTSSATTTASSSGTYTFGGLVAGTYAVTPSDSGFSYSPTSQTATIATANLTGINFTATAQKGSAFSISGTITPAAGGSGATVLLSGSVGATTTTNAAGNYTFSGLPNGTYTVLPIDAGFAYSPNSQTVTVNGANDTGVNFTAAAGQAHSVALTWNASTSTVSGYNVYRSTMSGSGFTRLNSSLISGVAYSDTTVAAGTTYFYVATAVDSSGDESSDSNQATAVIP
jgi:Carboxypeptidase regulatory-like domain